MKQLEGRSIGYMDFHPGGKDQLMLGAGCDMTADYQRVHPWVNMEGILLGVYSLRLIADYSCVWRDIWEQIPSP